MDLIYGGPPKDEDESICKKDAGPDYSKPTNLPF